MEKREEVTAQVHSVLGGRRAILNRWSVLIEKVMLEQRSDVGRSWSCRYLRNEQSCQEDCAWVGGGTVRRPMWLEGWSGTSARGELQGQRGGSEGPDHTGERLASFFFKGPDNKYFRLWSYKVSTIQMPL